MKTNRQIRRLKLSRITKFPTMIKPTKILGRKISRRSVIIMTILTVIRFMIPMPKKTMKNSLPAEYAEKRGKEEN